MMRRRPQIWNGILAVKSGSKVLVNAVPGNLGTGQSTFRIFDMNNTEGLADAFASKLKSEGVAIRPEDNASRLHDLAAKLPKRLPPTFESLLSRYSFLTFDAAGISFFGWGPESTELSDVASPQRGSLSELLLPAGYFQIGRPDTGSFDAICFDMNSQKQNREYRIVLADHEEILCNKRIKIRTELWPSFRNLFEVAFKSR